MHAHVVRIRGTSLVVAALRDNTPKRLEVDQGSFHTKGEDFKFGSGWYEPTCAGFQRGFPNWTGTDNLGLKSTAIFHVTQPAHVHSLLFGQAGRQVQQVERGRLLPVSFRIYLERRERVLPAFFIKEEIWLISVSLLRS